MFGLSMIPTSLKITFFWFYVTYSQFTYIAYAQKLCGLIDRNCGDNVAVVGERYRRGDSLCSQNKIYKFGLVNDGSLALCKDNVVVWKIDTCCSNNNPFFQHQRDGNIVVYDSVNGKRTILWSSKTAAIRSTELLIRDDGVTMLRSVLDKEKIFWSIPYQPSQCYFHNTACMGSSLGLNSIMFLHDHICSPSRQYTFGLDSLGNLSFCDGTDLKWSVPGDLYPTIALQGNGDLVLKSNSGIVLWTSRTSDNNVTNLKIQNDGVISLLIEDGDKVWSVSANTDITDDIIFPDNHYAMTGVPSTTPLPQTITPSMSPVISTIIPTILSTINNNDDVDNSIHPTHCYFGDAVCKGSDVGLKTRFVQNDHICSSDNNFTFGLDTVGHLVLCEGNSLKWSRKATNPSLRLQGDGNLVLKSNSNTIAWHSNTYDRKVSMLSISPSGVVSLKKANGKIVWSIPGSPNPLEFDDDDDNESVIPIGTNSCFFGDAVCKGSAVYTQTRFIQNDHICSSDNNFKFGLNSLGHLVLCEGNSLEWLRKATNASLRFQGDGNLVLTSNSNTIAWNSNTHNKKVSMLSISPSGVVSLEKANGKIVWSIPGSPNMLEYADDDNDYVFYDDGGHIYIPGDLYYDRTNNLYLAKGLNATRFGTTDEIVTYANGENSSQPVHDQPDAGACFDSGDGGFIYVSNEETDSGGVGAFKFNDEGQVVDYRIILSNTKRNCGGGKSPWGTWITGEENGNRGFFYEVHPAGKWSQKTKIVVNGGNYESAAFDDRDMRNLKVFGTNDRSDGELTRFAPNATVLEVAVQSGNYRHVLSSDGGSHDYLVLTPNDSSNDGTFRWTTNRTLGKRSAKRYFPNAEGIDHHNGLLFFVSKELRQLYVLDLDKGIYTRRRTVHGKFDGQPDQILHAIDPYNKESMVYFTEDGGRNAAGIYAQTTGGEKFAIVEGGKGMSDESTGFAICDRGRKLIMAFQDEGHLYLIQRRDGRRFEGSVADLKYHERN